ncbi:DUF429 domain-containing protein [Pseudodesulfovibrio sp. JC047]|uniref:DUF429 domain-containing protein n=1 Tax=Pseudodesulfovibrio sp. JC047 TaxID=2683199 RepID=UPI0013D56373|nr:DUF429 domain-containing protein [Pseudodesulfovibrio sp. JC047]NDV18173.1 DUF429 domain-containing protein [Pseudodesulfovibrio sp. JC047]
MKHVGIDGCKKGWFAVWTTNTHWFFELYPTFEAVWQAHSNAALLLVDMPVGLPETGTRQADTLTRHQLGPRKSSLFNTPVRSAVYARSKQAAKVQNRQLSGKSLSEQSLSIIPKIRELDQVMQSFPDARSKCFEAHPERCFASLGGEPQPFSKKDIVGIMDRVALLETHIPGLREFIAAVRTTHPMSHVAGDDILDACVLAVTAQRGKAGLRPIPDPPEIDATGLPMAIWFNDRHDIP